MSADGLSGWLGRSRNMRKYIIAICAVTVGIVGCTAYLISGAKSKPAEPTGYTIYVYDNGAAQLDVENVNKIIQLHKNTEIDGHMYMAGTIILPGDGSEVYYEYPRKDEVRK